MSTCMMPGDRKKTFARLRHDSVKTAKELHFPADIIERLNRSTSEAEVMRLMIDGRRRL